ncbi:MAG: hypothetical protein K6F97_08970 [Lachnospiraceae bacterium]|nr:hypothetical protein [Lachnospiraceae bacterium]
MVGIKNVFREYLLHKKYRKAMVILTILGFIMVAMSGPLGLYTGTIYGTLSLILVVPGYYRDAALPLSDEEIQKRYVSIAIFKEMQLGLYLVLNVIISYVTDNFCFRDLIKADALYVAVMYILVLLVVFENNLTSLKRKACNDVDTKNKAKDFIAVLPNIACFMCIWKFLQIDKAKFSYGEKILGTETIYTCILAGVFICLVISIAVKLRKWDIKDV